MRHRTWDILCDLLTQIVNKHGGSIYDPRCGKTWDCGQAVCAELYGPKWSTNPEYKAVNELPDSEPVPHEFFAAAERVLNADVGCVWEAMEAKP